MYGNKFKVVCFYSLQKKISKIAKKAFTWDDSLSNLWILWIFWPIFDSWPFGIVLTLGHPGDRMDKEYLLPDVDWALTSAPCAISKLTMSTCPALAASIKGVQSPLMPRSSTFAFIANKTCFKTVIVYQNFKHKLSRDSSYRLYIRGLAIK